MKYTYFSFLLCIVFLQLDAGCTHPNRTYFTIDPNDRKIVVSVRINDSIAADLVFDTGARRLGVLDLDSTFCVANPDIMGEFGASSTSFGGSAWLDYFASSKFYTKETLLKIAGQNLVYNEILVYDWKNYFSTSNSVGLFNIPENNTTHVWELNFEHNYIELHSAKDFSMPKGSFVAPMVEDGDFSGPFNIKLPIKIKTSNGDTLTLERTYLIDSAMAWDVVLMNKADEQALFRKQDDVVWTSYLNSYVQSCTVEATLSGIKMDSLRIYAFGKFKNIKNDYLIGQNFLKRFNVFFDMQRRLVGFQPIKFQRIVNPRGQRFHFSYGITPQGSWWVTYVGDYASNRFKTADLREGDEIIRVNGRSVKEITVREHYDMEVKSDTITYDIIRDGKSMQIVVIIDKNEKQGD